jgi:hypothetical protein
MTNDAGSSEMKAMIQAIPDEQLIEKVKGMLTNGFEAEDEWSTKGITNKDWYFGLVDELKQRGINPELTKPIK